MKVAYALNKLTADVYPIENDNDIELIFTSIPCCCIKVFDHYPTQKEISELEIK